MLMLIEFDRDIVGYRINEYPIRHEFMLNCSGVRARCESEILSGGT